MRLSFTLVLAGERNVIQSPIATWTAADDFQVGRYSLSTSVLRCFGTYPFMCFEQGHALHRAAS